eukprot:snap_masked-scaffold_52-processed-gene-1.60-mRNA-1 protein AED:1.00 eAED:1.00 QI:0/-1/0/0/-1/1/1/0/399
MNNKKKSKVKLSRRMEGTRRLNTLKFTHMQLPRSARSGLSSSGVIPEVLNEAGLSKVPPSVVIHPRGYPIASCNHQAPIIPEKLVQDMCSIHFHSFKAELSVDYTYFDITSVPNSETATEAQHTSTKPNAKKSSILSKVNPFSYLQNRTLSANSTRAIFHLHEFTLQLHMLKNSNGQTQFQQQRPRASSYQQFANSTTVLNASNKQQTVFHKSRELDDSFVKQDSDDIELLDLAISNLHGIFYPKEGTDFSLSFYVPNNDSDKKARGILITFQLDDVAQAKMAVKYVLAGVESVVKTLKRLISHIENVKCSTDDDPDVIASKKLKLERYVKLKYDLVVLLHGFGGHQEVKESIEENINYGPGDHKKFWEEVLEGVIDLGDEQEDYLDVLRKEVEENSVV